jgi:tetratricopeptide (TPR) repeat protein
VASGVFVLALGVYVATLGPTIDFWDCAEYVTVSHIVGVPHQPGTPLYVLVGRVFDIVLGSADITRPSLHTAWAVNFMSAFFSALAVLFVYLSIVRLARRADPDSGWLAMAGGVVGALFLVFSETFWNSAVEAEVYGLAAFAMALLTWLGLVWYDSRTERRSDWLLLLLVYLFGLGVGFHLGSLLVYPGFFLLVWLSRDRQLPVLDLLLVSVGLALFLASTTFITDGGVLLALLILYGLACIGRAAVRRPVPLLGLVLFVAGLSVHAMMVIRAGATPEPVINQTAPDNFQTLLSVLRREQYPALNPLERQAPLSVQFRYYYEFFSQQFTFVSAPGGLSRLGVLIGPVALGLLGMLHGLRRARPVIWLLVALYLINADGLTLYLNFTDHEVRPRDYFYFAAFMYYTVFIGLGVASLLRYTAGAEGPTLALREREVSPPPPDRPWGVQPFFLRVVVAFVVAMLCLVFTPGGAKATGIGFFLFGLPFAGLWVGRYLDRQAKGQPWGVRPWTTRLALAVALLAAVVAAGALLSVFASGIDRVFVLVCYGAILGGAVLVYGEPLAGPRPAVLPAAMPAVRTGYLAKIGAVLLMVIAAMPLLQPGHRKWFEHDRSENRIAHEYAWNILAGLDRNAVIFTNGDNDTFPIWFLQEVEHFRRDVTVVNLSLVNLTWYVKQLRNSTSSLPLSYTDAELDNLRAQVFRDPTTGETQWVLVRDYVVKDIVDTNRRNANRRPVFFAVTIPRENMDFYFPFLQMEGLAYRLTESRAPDGMPTTDADRLLANVLSVYKLDALLTGDDDTRQALYAEKAGWQSDRPAEVQLAERAMPAQMDLEPLVNMVGENRRDVYRSPNAVNLLGNYPVSVARAGFDYLRRAEELRTADGGIALADTGRYDLYTARALIAYELARKFDPTNALVATGYYPLLLLERGKIAETLAYLESLHGSGDPAVEEQAILAAMRGFLGLGKSAAAIAWLDAQIAARKDWVFAYDVLFRIYEADGNVVKAREVVRRFEQVNGKKDQHLEDALQKFERGARDQEQQRLKDVIQGGGQ